MNEEQDLLKTQIGVFSDTKANLAVWEYQNTTEEFVRRITLNVDALREYSDEQRTFILSVIDNTVKAITTNFDILPKTGSEDNRASEKPLSKTDLNQDPT